jgi:anti-sigma regulatory factor (Ser/Thr protein kinase)
METIRTRVPAEMRHRESVGRIVRDVCAQIEAERGCSGLEWRVLSAFNEAFNNLVEHGFEPGCRGEVSIVITLEPARLVLELSDDGCGFDFARASAEPLAAIDDLDVGGMGLFIMRRSVSEVRYVRGAPNRLTLIHELAEFGASGEADPASNRE